MNAENFKEFIENPSRLYQLSYQELKSLVLQYPYSANLHYLLLQKSAMENHRELENNRHKAAAYSLDRTHLYQLIRKLTSTETKEPLLQLDLDEEFLELKDLSLLEVSPEMPAEEPVQLANMDIEDIDRTSSNGGTRDAPPEEELDFSLDVFPFSPGETEEEQQASFKKEEDASEPPLEMIRPQPAPDEQLPDDLPAEAPMEKPAYLAPPAIIEKVVTVAAITGQLRFFYKESKEKVEPEPIPAPVEQKAVQTFSDLAQRHKVLSQKLDELIASRASAAAPPSHAPAEPLEKKPAPQPKGSFTSWVQQFQPDHVKQQLSELMEAQKREELKRLEKKKKKAARKSKKSAKDQRIIEFAERSLNEHQTIISETLAELLAEQGQIEKSVKMYERLKLVFPEKSAYFAAIIEKLKNK